MYALISELEQRPSGGYFFEIEYFSFLSRSGNSYHCLRDLWLIFG